MTAAATPEANTVRDRLVNIASTSVVLGAHLLGVAALLVRPSLPVLLFALASFLLQTFGITAGYHRYFSHHAFRTGRLFQAVLAWLGCTAMQNGPLWWASCHRRHHRFADREGDPHSPVTNTLWHAHLGWVLSGLYDRPDLANVKELAGFPELILLERFKWVPTLALAVACAAFGGLGGLVWVFGVATCLAFHAPLLVNSIGHKWGARRYETKDSSRNNAALGFFVLGEGWHNNHHHAPGLARHGLAWWEIDVTYYGLWLLSKVGIVWALRLPKARVARA